MAKPQNKSVDLIEKFAEKLLQTDEFNRINSDTLNTISKAILNCKSLKEAESKAFSIFSKLQIKPRQDFMTKFMFIAFIVGYHYSGAENG